MTLLDDINRQIEEQIKIVTRPNLSDTFRAPAAVSLNELLDVRSKLEGQQTTQQIRPSTVEPLTEMPDVNPSSPNIGLLLAIGALLFLL